VGVGRTVGLHKHLINCLIEKQYIRGYKSKKAGGHKFV
jgi:hypothetical protein